MLDEFKLSWILTTSVFYGLVSIGTVYQQFYSISDSSFCFVFQMDWSTHERLTGCQPKEKSWMYCPVEGIDLSAHKEIREIKMSGFYLRAAYIESYILFLDGHSRWSLRCD